MPPHEKAICSVQPHCVHRIRRFESRRAGGPVFRIYTLIQEGDTAKAAGASAQALAKYKEADAALKNLKLRNPNWNERVVNYRLDYLASKISELAPATPEPAASQPAPQTGQASPPAGPPAAPPANQLQEQLRGLQEQIRQLQSDKSLLESKLKEALAAQPAAVDPRELETARDQIRSLEKENDLLKVSAEKSKPAPDESGSTVADLKRQLAEATQKLASGTDAAARMKSDLEALREENQILKKQLANGHGAAADSNADTVQQLKQARERIAVLESDRAALRLEKTALENRIQQSGTPAVAPVAGTSGDVELAGQLETLRTRLAVLEAQKVPYSATELALMKPSSPQPETPRSQAKPVNELPAGAARLIAAAQRDFAAGHLDAAEQKYQEVLKNGQQNVYTIANLTAIQLEQNHLDDANKTIQQALSIAPEDAYSLMILGQIKFRQGQYDASLDALSRAAKLAPENAEVQNNLGLVLSQKGMRSAAEAAFRKAVQIRQDYASAHNNLAVFYITQNPPWVELAHWHYQRALDAGMPRNPDLEKLLNTSATETSAAAK